MVASFSSSGCTSDMKTVIASSKEEASPTRHTTSFIRAALPSKSSRVKRNESFRLMAWRKSVAGLMRSARIGETVSVLGVVVSTGEVETTGVAGITGAADITGATDTTGGGFRLRNNYRRLIQ